jgi:hypothetical protein
VSSPVAVHVFVPTLDERYDEHGVGPVEPLAEELPLPTDLGAGQILVVTDGGVAPTGLFARFRRRRVVHRAVRGAALLARGYVDVAGGVHAGHDDAVWGRVPRGA